MGSKQSLLIRINPISGFVNPISSYVNPILGFLSPPAILTSPLWKTPPLTGAWAQNTFGFEIKSDYKGSQEPLL